MDTWERIELLRERSSDADVLDLLLQYLSTDDCEEFAEYAAKEWDLGYELGYHDDLEEDEEPEEEYERDDPDETEPERPAVLPSQMIGTPDAKTAQRGL